MPIPKPQLSHILSGVLLVAVLAFLAQGFVHRSEYAAEPGPANDPPSAYSDSQPKLVAAMFYSAWCSSCAVLDPRLRDIAPEFDGRAVQFVKFDFSLGPNDTQRSKARSLGIEAAYMNNEGATGYMLLIDRTSEEVLASVTMSMDRETIRDTINDAITAVAAAGKTALPPSPRRLTSPG